MIRTLKVRQGVAPERLDVYLAASMGQPRSALQRLIKADLVLVNGQPGRASYKVAPGDDIEILDPPPAEPEPFTLKLPILYQDDDVVIVDKPAGLSVHPGNGRQTEATVATFAKTVTTDVDGDRPGIVHRLDRDTSGVLIIARSTAAKTFLQHEWQSHRVVKTYQLLAIGSLRPTEATIDLPLNRDPARPTRRRVMPGGRPSKTHYKVLEEYPGFSLVEATPETGRTHQLRVHFAATGHHIAGDITYGTPKRVLGLKRQFLHASRLSIVVPSGKTVTVESPLPPDLKAVIDKLHLSI
jgi:23S rRNA pseudouridine1911/1915/1917 synthase